MNSELSRGHRSSRRDAYASDLFRPVYCYRDSLHATVPRAIVTLFGNTIAQFHLYIRHGRSLTGDGTDGLHTTLTIMVYMLSTRLV